MRRTFSQDKTQGLKMSYKIFFLLNRQNNYLFSLHLKISAEILAARYMFYFYKKKLKELMQVKQTDILDLQVFYGELIEFQ